MTMHDAYDFRGKAYIEDGEVVLNFGRYKGAALCEVPTDYLLWMIEQDFPRDLLDEAEDELEGR